MRRLHININWRYFQAFLVYDVQVPASVLRILVSTWLDIKIH
jgi:hypothetical protein